MLKYQAVIKNAAGDIVERLNAYITQSVAEQSAKSARNIINLEASRERTEGGNPEPLTVEVIEVEETSKPVLTYRGSERICYRSR